MSFDLAEVLHAALDDGCSLAELEAAFLARAETEDEIAAAWLSAWAYDAIRPSHDNLAARIIDRLAPPHTPKRREALDRPVFAGRAQRTLVRPPRLSALARAPRGSSRSSTPAADQALNYCAASDAATECFEVSNERL